MARIDRATPAQPTSTRTRSRPSGGLRRIASAASAALVIAALAGLGSTASAAPDRSDAASGGDHLAAAHQAGGVRPERAMTPVRRAVPLTPTGTKLPLSGFGDIVADPAHDRLYVSGGTKQGGLAVVGADGTVQHAITDLPGADGMALSPDGSELYVALATGDAIEQIETSTLGTSSPTMTSLSLGVDTCPTSVAVTSGLVWVGYGCDDGAGALGVVDPATGVAQLAVAGPFDEPPTVDATPALGGALFLGVSDGGQSFLQRYAVAAAATATATWSRQVETGSHINDMALTPDGHQVIVADGGTYHHQAFSTADLSSTGSYASAAYPNSVAVGDDGFVAVGSFNNAGPDLWLYPPRASQPRRTVDYGENAYLPDAALAVMGHDAYSVTWHFGTAFRLHVLTTLLPTKGLSIAASRSSVRFRGKVHVTVHLKSPGSNRQVEVFATPYQGHRHLVGQGTLRGGTFTTTVRVDRRTRLTAGWEGNDAFGPTQRSITVKAHARVVSALHHAYATRHGWALVHVSRNPTMSATVRPEEACLTFRAQKLDTRGRWRAYGTLTCLPPGHGIVFQGTHVVGERVRFQAVFRGDKANLGDQGPWSRVLFTR